MSKHSKSKSHKSNIEDSVMSKIKSGELRMHPHYYYVILSFLGIGFVILSGVAVSYFISVVTLWSRIQATSGPAYGARRNLSLLASNFPWWALFLALLVLAVAVVVIRRLGSLYKLKLMYLIPAVITIAILIGMVLSYTSLPNAINNHRPQPICDSSTMECHNNGGGYMRGRQMK